MSEQSIEFAASLLQDNGAGTEFSQQEWLKERQQEARTQLKMYPLPTTAEEEWRFTDLTALYKSTLSVPRVDVSVDPSVINSLLIPEAVSSIVLVDGVYSPDMSVVDEGKAKIKVSNLKAALQDKSLTSILKDKLNRIPGDGISAFGEMNTALFKDIAVIHVDSSVREFETIHVLNVSTGKHTFSHPRLLLIAEKQAKVRILEDYVGIGGFGYMTNSVSEISLAAGAQVIHVKLQRDDDSAYHIAHTHVGVDNGASYRNWSISVGAAVSRHNLVTRQRQEGGDIQIKGLALGHEKRIVDTHSCIEHTEPHGDRKSTRLNSSQQNRNLLLSARASVDAKPELEIFADDVKCAHGATVGQVSEDELFYLKTRGLDDVMARNVLNYAFAKEVIDDLPIASLAGVIESYIKEQTKT